MIFYQHDYESSGVVKGNKFDLFIKYTFGFTRKTLNFCNSSCHLLKIKSSFKSLHVTDIANQLYWHVNTKYLAV